MNIKVAFFLMPLTWAIFIYLITFGFDSTLGLTANAIVSFILTAVTVVTLSSLKVLDSGLSDGANKLLFILVFGGLFYGVTVASLYLGDSPANLGNFNNGVLFYDTLFDVDIDLKNIPPYIKQVVISPSAINPILIINPNYDSTATVPNGTSIAGFGVSANTGYNNSMFVDMPYFAFVNVALGLIYAFGLYLMVAES